MLEHKRYNISNVLLTVTIAFLGAYVSMCLCEQLRQSMIEDKVIFGAQVTISHRKKHLLYLLLMSLSLAGVSIWTMHFVGMHSCHLYNEQGERVHILYNVSFEILTFFVCWFTSFVGVTIASYDQMFSKSKSEIIEEFIADSKKLSLREIRKMTANNMLYIISTKELTRLLVAGTIMGSGIILMHYIGMESVEFAGKIHFQPGLVAFSVIIAIVASILSFWIFFRLLSIFPSLEWLRVLSGLLLALAVTGMHFTGMESARYEIMTEIQRPLATKELHQHMMSSEHAYEGVLIGGNIILWVVTVFALWNYRTITLHQAKIIKQADSILEKLVITANYTASNANNNTTTNSNNINSTTKQNNSTTQNSTNNAPAALKLSSSTKENSVSVNSNQYSLLNKLRQGSWSSHHVMQRMMGPNRMSSKATAHSSHFPSLVSNTNSNTISSTSANDTSNNTSCGDNSETVSAPPIAAVSVSVLRTLAEAYFTKRLRGHKRRLALSLEGQYHLQREAQLNMSFSEFVGHICLLVCTGDWQAAWLACWLELDSSGKDSQSLGSDASGLNSSNHNSSNHNNNTESVVLNNSMKGTNSVVIISQIIDHNLPGNVHAKHKSHRYENKSNPSTNEDDIESGNYISSSNNGSSDKNVLFDLEDDGLQNKTDTVSINNNANDTLNNVINTTSTTGTTIHAKDEKDDHQEDDDDIARSKGIAAMYLVELSHNHEHTKNQTSNHESTNMMNRFPLVQKAAPTAHINAAIHNPNNGNFHPNHHHHAIYVVPEEITHTDSNTLLDVDNNNINNSVV